AASEQSELAASVVRQQSTRLSDDLASVTREALFELAQRPATSEPAREVAGAFRLTQQFQLSDHDFLTDWSVEDALVDLANTADIQITAIESDAASIDDPKIWIQLAEIAASCQALQHLPVTINRVAEQCAQQSLNTHHLQALAAVLICLREGLSREKLTHAMSLVYQALLSTDGSSYLDQLGPSWRAHQASDLLRALTSVIQADMNQVSLLLDSESPLDIRAVLPNAIAVLDRIAGALHLLGLADQYPSVAALASELRQAASDNEMVWASERFAQQWVLLQTRMAPLAWQGVPATQPNQSPPSGQTQLDTIYVDEARALIQTLRDCVSTSNRFGLIQAAHTLAGCSATVGLEGLASLALALESLLEHQSSNGMKIDASLIDEVIDAADDLLQRFALSGERGECAAWVARLQSYADTAQAEQDDYREDQVNTFDAVNAANELNQGDEFNQADEASEFNEFNEAGEATDAADAADAADATEADELYEIFKFEAADLLPQLEEALLHWQQHPEDTSQATRLLRVLHTLKGSARMAGHAELGHEFHQAET
ncbi:MAG: Hpt domain-containing protein, partial [Burkholderiaceae bacterium]